MSCDSSSQLLRSPMEQFEMMPLYSMYIGWLDISVTNQTLTLVIMITSVLCLSASLMSPLDPSHFVIPFRFQFLLEQYLSGMFLLSYDSLGEKDGSTFFPLMLTLSFYMLCLNLSGLVPHSTAMLSHVIVTVTMSGSFFIGMNYICMERSGISFFSLFLPPNTSMGIALMLIPVEALSFFCSPFSLATSLFANSMGGHTLIKMVVGCAWSLMNCSGLLYLVHGASSLILVPLMVLETAIALIQSSVFVNLMCMYMGEALSV